MARFFITGSSDGLGLLTAQRLVAAGYRLVLHARNTQRAAETKMACPGAEAVLVADLTSIEETKQLAAEANAMCEKDAGRNSEAWDEDDGYAAVIHNAGVYSAMEGVPGKSGLPSLFSVNVLAPYVLTCLMAATRSSNPPKRLIYVSSGLHRSGSSAALRPGRLEHCSYSDSKLADVMLAKAFARRLQKPEDLVCSSVDPGWVPTKMGGRSAPGDIDAAVDTYVMLALGEGDAAKAPSGAYFYDSKVARSAKAAEDAGAQVALLEELQRISGVSIPK